MDWKKVKTPSGSKLFLVHNFTFMHSGTTYTLEIDEFADGICTGHGEQANDKAQIISSISGKSVGECLEGLIQKIQSRHKK